MLFQRVGTGAGPLRCSGVQRFLLPCLCLLSACSPGSAQLAAIKQLRSATAEWALVNREAVQRNLPAAYVDGMRSTARRQIGEAARSLGNGNEEAARRAAVLQALPPDADAGLLARHAASLKAIEQQLESA